MYADRSYTPRGARPASFGAALAINGALIAGLIFAAPKVLTPEAIPVLNITNVPLPVTPPPQPEPLPAEPQARTPEPAVPNDIFVPERKVPTPATNTVETSTVERPFVPPLLPLPSPTGGLGSGIAEPTPTPLPPLIPAQADPRYARYLQPDYPAAEQRAGNEGRVTVRVLVGADGRVQQVEKVRAASDAFYEATRRQALTRWRFTPASRGGTPEASWLVMTVWFEMNR